MMLQANATIPELTALIGEIPAESIVSRSVYNDEQARVTLFGFAAGEKLTEHTSTQAAILHFLQGEATVTLGEETVTAVANTWIHMPPHLPHSVEAQSDVLMLLIMLKEK